MPTHAEKIAILQAKGAALLKWFEGKGLPPAPFLLKQAHTVLDSGKFFKAQKGRMDAYQDNPFNKLYVNAYLELDHLKKYMEDAKPRTTDVQPRPKPKTDGPGNNQQSLFMA